jgi:cytochrome b
VSATSFKIRVWDLPTRLFHWTLAALVTGSFVSVKLGNMVWHGRLGYAVLALLLLVSAACALDNGVGRLPAMGWSRCEPARLRAQARCADARRRQLEHVSVRLERSADPGSGGRDGGFGAA